MLELRTPPISIFIATVSGLLLLRILLSYKSIIYSLRKIWQILDDYTQAYQNFEISRYNQWGQENSLYRHAVAYVAALPSLEDSSTASLFSSGRKPNDFQVHLDIGHSATDTFLGRRLYWTNSASDRLVLRLRRQDRSRVLRPYLQHIESVAEDLELRRREIRLYTALSNSNSHWRSVPFTHPANLDTVAMDAELKTRIRNDLENFSKGKVYYHRLGRVWRRSYLLYGPPGTGKSTFVAAMAKFLCYDVYDVDLSQFSPSVNLGRELKSLLLNTTPRSIILVEDLDLHLKSADLASILNFMDGVFSCCGEERVMVFTMTTSLSNGCATLEPVVLRPGRLDVHIQFPLCDFLVFKMLASSYLGLSDHKLYPQVEEVFQNGAKISPAEVGEIMIANRGSPSRALKTVINALHLSGTVGSFGRRLSNGGEQGALAGRRSVDVMVGENGAVQFGKESIKEFKKLYGMIKMRSGSKKDDGVMSMSNGNGGASDGSQ